MDLNANKVAMQLAWIKVAYPDSPTQRESSELSTHNLLLCARQTIGGEAIVDDGHSITLCRVYYQLLI